MRLGAGGMVVVACAALCAAAPARAGEFRAAYGNWDFGIAGTTTQNGNTYDFEKDLSAHATGHGSLQVAWDTGPGWWRPDLGFQDSSLRAAGRNQFTITQIFPPGTTTRTLTVDANFRDQDFTARYPWGWGPVGMAAGIAVKHLRGTVVVTDSSQSQPERGDYDETFPQLQLQARWPIARWLTFVAAGQGAQSGGKKAYEWHSSAEIGLGPVLLEAGWQRKRYDIQVGSDALNATLDGALLRAGVQLR